MKITYIYHSGFLIETNQCYYLFDYYKGDLPKLEPTKPILVFASHRHADHYNREIFELLKTEGMKKVYGVLSKDIPKRMYPEDIKVQTVTFHKEYELPCDTSLRTLLSTDEGVAFIIKCPEGTIYHAGDLNDWVWAGEGEQYNKQMTGNYRHEIQMLKDVPVTVAFLPLDPRQEKDYANGIRYFLENVEAGKVCPMHYWEKPQTITRFMEAYPEYKDKVLYTESLIQTDLK